MYLVARWPQYYKPKNYNLPATIFFLLITRQLDGIRRCTEGLVLEILPVFRKECEALGGEKEI